MTAALQTRAEVFVTVTPDGGLTNVSPTQAAAAQWSRPHDAVVRFVEPATLEVTQAEFDAMVTVIRHAAHTGVAIAVVFAATEAFSRMVVPAAVAVEART